MPAPTSHTATHGSPADQVTPVCSTDAAGSSDRVLVLTDADVAELVAARDAVRRASLPLLGVGRADFPLPTLGPGLPASPRSSTPTTATSSSAASPCTDSPRPTSGSSSGDWAGTWASPSRRTPSVASSVRPTRAGPTSTAVGPTSPRCSSATRAAPSAWPTPAGSSTRSSCDTPTSPCGCSTPSTTTGWARTCRGRSPTARHPWPAATTAGSASATTGAPSRAPSDSPTCRPSRRPTSRCSTSSTRPRPPRPGAATSSCGPATCSSSTTTRCCTATPGRRARQALEPLRLWITLRHGRALPAAFTWPTPTYGETGGRGGVAPRDVVDPTHCRTAQADTRR